MRHSDTVFLLLFLANAKCNGADASTSWFSFTNEVVFARARIPVAGSIVPKTGGIDQFETILNIRRAPRGLVLISFLVSPTRVLHRGSIHVEEIALNIQSIYFVLFSLQLLLLLWTSKQTNQQSYITKYLFRIQDFVAIATSSGGIQTSEKKHTSYLREG